MGLILSSIVTEKAVKATERTNVYSFYVSPSANKISIRNEIKKLFSVDVVDVRTLILSPKIKVKFTKGGLQVGKTNKLKKAIVRVAEGQQIDFFGN